MKQDKHFIACVIGGVLMAIAILIVLAHYGQQYIN